MTAVDRIIDKVAQSIARYSLIEKGDTVLVGFSGGTDSVALLHILHRLKDRLGFSLAAVYINHYLRPRAARKEARFCEQFCAGLEVPFRYEEVDIPRLAGDDRAGLEETARIHRYRVLDRVARDGAYSRIAVGHHRGDRAETILFNLFRGAGRQGLVGIQAKRGRVIRPLYDLTRDEILSYLRAGRLRYMVDSSNRNRRFTRNRIRNRIIPLIRREINDAAMDNVLRFSEIIADEEAYLREKTSRIYHKLLTLTPGGKIRLDLRGRLEYDVWFKRRLALQLLTDAGLFDDIEFSEIERLARFMGGRSRSRLAVRNNLLAELAGDMLYLYRPGARIGRYEVTIPGRYRLEYPRVWITLEYAAAAMVRKLKGGRRTVAYVDAAGLEGDLYISGLKRGARFHPYGRPGSKKVGDFLTDQRYPRPLRDELPVLYDRRGIVWLAGVEIDHRVGVRSNTRKVVEIKIGTYRAESPLL